MKTQNSYPVGHPWYYLLGGKVPTPKQIQAKAIASEFRGYKANDLHRINKMSEPMRSEQLR
ncbi:MAG: hypothetical protein AAF478_10790 [Pseudomonadota bacterium]